MHCIAVDDEPMALDIIRMHAANVPFLRLAATFVDAIEAITYVQREKVDLLFVDVNMPDISGLQLVRALPTRPLLIFTTAYAQYAAESYEVSAVDYLLKPFTFSRFLTAVTKAHEQFVFRQLPPAKPATDFFFVRSGYQQVKINVDELLYVEGAGNYLTFVMAEQNVVARMTFPEVLALLPEPSFMRVHKSFIVAIRHVDRIEPNQLIIRKTRIPVGESYRKLVDELLKQNGA